MLGSHKVGKKGSIIPERSFDFQGCATVLERVAAPTHTHKYSQKKLIQCNKFFIL